MPDSLYQSTAAIRMNASTHTDDRQLSFTKQLPGNSSHGNSATACQICQSTWQN